MVFHSFINQQFNVLHILISFTNIALFFGHRSSKSGCLNDEPNVHFPIFEDMDVTRFPGQIMDRHFQCKLQFGDGFRQIANFMV